MRRLVFMTLLMVWVLTTSAQTYPPKDTPQLEFALQLRVTLLSISRLHPNSRHLLTAVMVG